MLGMDWLKCVLFLIHAQTSFVVVVVVVVVVVDVVVVVVCLFVCLFVVLFWCLFVFSFKYDNASKLWGKKFKKKKNRL